ncbi:lycopene cyclase [Ilyomonas limi]|uniref:Lycopene cyclase n=1 Tax=Ilyomonas limi TaxID=2575867 RepID=A0A4U3L8G1_9BACT|nr:lycopene cyclase family protein [Ilyomonas limi]TKK71558.1 lycopene cyclase [Ilyomonas limi]
MQAHYDYIITGAGCAGLSLLMHMMQHHFFTDKQILLIDKDVKQSNDRTWCFWETSPGLFEDIVHHRWQQLDFYSNTFSARFDIDPYTYKMIRGIDFYNYVLQRANHFTNVSFVQEEVINSRNESEIATVNTINHTYTADYVFNSIIFQPTLLQTPGSLLQHFKGWIVETPMPTFNDRVATFMDFRIKEKPSNTFVYVLPVSNNKALVEYTVFSPALLNKEDYDVGLQQYIQQFLNLSSYKILDEEFGVIPMSTYSFSKGEGSIVNIGTAGGQTKSSSGFTFQFIQKHAAAIVQALMQAQTPHVNESLFDKRFRLYDDTLLNILYYQKSYASTIFSDLFKKNKPQQVLKFLDNETTVTEELKIMITLPKILFLPAALRQLFG